MPQSYIRPESEGTRLSQVSDCENVSVIVQQVGQASNSHGFFQVIDHEANSKTVRRSTSLNVKKKKVKIHNWRGYGRVHCDTLPLWSSNPPSFKMALPKLMPL
ncbi:hypothetical protein K1719_000627 [Acacia pycnantha]|nr:hypothetical protein K1719_000627 [Acacia pycnantha]